MDDDVDLIVATAHDYFDGYFDGDAARMRRALHPDLVKRSPGQDQASSLAFITAEQMVAWTADGDGVGLADTLADRRIVVEVLDVEGGIASALVRSEPFHEYLHLVRTRDGWKIANALYLAHTSR
ncbi:MULTISPECIES: nuclear transport factor 2 family protein [unclassified Nocardioides]|uniref:nuclear transport factor 2 family protein n=1 Tax=unclassified Nocardioides TaxID=2615069 RepID=UPI00361215A7